MPFTVDDFHDLIRLVEPGLSGALSSASSPHQRVAGCTRPACCITCSERGAIPGPSRSAATYRSSTCDAYRSGDGTDGASDGTDGAGDNAGSGAGAHGQPACDAYHWVTALTERVTTLAAAQERMDSQLATLTEQVTALTRVVHTLTVDVGTLKDKSLEADYRSRGHAYLSRVVRRPHVLTSDELMTIIEDARDSGMLSDIEAQDLYEIDLVVRGRRAEDRLEVYLVVEVSWGVGPHDVERAVQRAHTLAHIGLVTIPVVAGEHILPEAAELARQSQVWQVTNGRAIPPAAAPSAR